MNISPLLLFFPTRNNSDGSLNYIIKFYVSVLIFIGLMFGANSLSP